MQHIDEMHHAASRRPAASVHMAGPCWHQHQACNRLMFVNTPQELAYVMQAPTSQWQKRRTKTAPHRSAAWRAGCSPAHQPPWSECAASRRCPRSRACSPGAPHRAQVSRGWHGQMLWCHAGGRHSCGLAPLELPAAGWVQCMGYVHVALGSAARADHHGHSAPHLSACRQPRRPAVRRGGQSPQRQSPQPAPPPGRRPQQKVRHRRLGVGIWQRGWQQTWPKW